MGIGNNDRTTSAQTRDSIVSAAKKYCRKVFFYVVYKSYFSTLTGWCSNPRPPRWRRDENRCASHMAMEIAL